MAQWFTLLTTKDDGGHFFVDDAPVLASKCICNHSSAGLCFNKIQNIDILSISELDLGNKFKVANFEQTPE